MIKTISNTTFTLAIISVLNFVLVALVANYLGETGVATMGLIVLGISFVVMISNLVGGSALVYLSPRNSVFTLVIISYFWAVISAIFMGAVLWFFELVPRDYVFWGILIALFECFFSIHNQIFLGKEKLKTHNSLKLTQKIAQVVVFIYIGITLNNFVYSLVISYLISLAFSLVALSKQLDSYRIVSPFSLFKTAFTYGLQIQLSNIVQLMNYRILYFFIEKSMGGILGIFIVAVQLAESLWIPSKALAIIQYGKVSNEKVAKKKSLLTVSFLHLSFLITGLAIVALLLVPDSWILSIFGKDISGTKPIIYSLSIGIMAVAITQSFSHYLAGEGKYHYLMIATVLGLIPMLAGGMYAINTYGLIGAGFITSLSYSITCVYLAFVFYKESGLPLKQIFISKNSLTQTIKLLKKR